MRAIPREVSEVQVKDADDAYALGLWCADSYWWSSSVGLSNVEPALIQRFAAYLVDRLDRERLRLRIYQVASEPVDPISASITEKVSVRPSHRMKRTAYHVYVNSRPLLRWFRQARDSIPSLPIQLIGPYVAGRFDGDGNLGSRVRIAYTTRSEAETDAKLLSAAGVAYLSVLYYSKTNEYCIYIHKRNEEDFVRLISPFSWKTSLHPVETEMASLDGDV